MHPKFCLECPSMVRKASVSMGFPLGKPTADVVFPYGASHRGVYVAPVGSILGKLPFIATAPERNGKALPDVCFV